MAGKIVIPLSFVPAVLVSPNNVTILGWSLVQAVTLLAATAAIQAIAHERSAPKAMTKLVLSGLGATVLGLTVGNLVPKAFATLTTLVGQLVK